MSFNYQSLSPHLIESVKSWTENNFDSKLNQLMQLVKIRSLAWPGVDQTPLNESAETIKHLFYSTEIFETVEIIQSAPDGTPAIIARREAKPGYPQVLLYAHHDIQPAGDLDQWKTEPFEPTVIEDRLFGRGASDDKAGVITHLAACEILRDSNEEINVGVTVFIEGEEEIGSPNFVSFLKANREKLTADLIVVADSGNFELNTPALTSSLRGLVSLEFSVSTLDHPLHSGVFGGVVPDSMLAMTKLLATLHNEDGSVAVDGLKSMPESNIDVAEDFIRSQSGVLDGVELIGKGGLVDRSWYQPSITVIGIDNPKVSESSNTLQASSRCKISARIAPNDDPISALQAIKNHILGNAPFGSKIEFFETETGSPYLARESWATNLAKDAMQAAYERPAVDMGVGGSIPFIAEFGNQFPDAEVLVTGVEDPDARAHSPNESQHLPTFRKTIQTHGLILLQANRIHAE
ncbi:MAG: M20/M25/M40 family metallo-hydrolase [Microbacteriaceae bacterium]|nr:M20/M25/M40 family metallo-hydrolase [Microbacteriaceae bacterium]